MAATPDERALPLLLEEYFNAEDGRFLETLRQVRSPKFLAGFADRWKKDPRSWARQQIFSYLEQPLDRAGHQPIIKRLFKHAEENKDDELMGAFLVAFDCLVRRVKEARHRWDFQARDTYEEEKLVTPRNVIPSEMDRNGQRAMSSEQVGYIMRYLVGGRLFNYHTRYYLRRRAWRYFRKLGFQRAEGYPQAIARALARYRNEDLAQGENILDSWGLLHACFGEHDALEFQATHVVLKEGRSLGELSAKPEFPETWQTPKAVELVLSLSWQGQARLVRVWSMQLLRTLRQTLPLDLRPEQLLRLLDHEDEEVQQFGAELLASVPGLEKMPVSFWLQLVKTKNLTALQTLCDLFTKYVSAERLDLPQCVELASAQATPVARMGLQFLKTRAITTPEQRATLSTLGQAKCEAIAKELGDWVFTILGLPTAYNLEHVQPFFDSLLAGMRETAWNWLSAPESPGYSDPVLWSRLTETPFDDLRLRLVDHLERRTKLPATNGNDLTPLWSSVLLGVHRGGRQKVKAVRQVGAALQKDPGRIEALLPVLAVAVRSVRRPEARAGLAAVVSAVEARPELAPLVKQHLPELQFLQ